MTFDFNLLIWAFISTQNQTYDIRCHTKSQKIPKNGHIKQSKYYHFFNFSANFNDAKCPIYIDTKSLEASLPKSTKKEV